MQDRAPGGRKKKVLAYLFGSLGDSIVAIPALRAIRRRFPNAEIVLLQNFESERLVKASEVVPSSLIDRDMSYKSRTGGAGRLFSFLDLMWKIRSERFDAVVYAVMSERPVRSVLRDKYFFRACGIAQAYGFHAIPPSELWPIDPDGHPGVSEHEAVFRLRRLSLDGLEVTPETDLATPLFEFNDAELEKADAWLRISRCRPHLPLVSIAPGCKSRSNLWPFENFVGLGRKVLENYDCEFVVTGGPAEHELGEKLIAALGSGINAAGQFGVKESAALLSRCDLHVGLDTGTMHLAAAAGARCFVIFGERSNPGLWYPLGAGHTIVYHRVSCAGCHTQSCPRPGHPCMTSITVEAAWRHLREVLDRDAPVGSERVRVFAV